MKLSFGQRSFRMLPPNLGTWKPGAAHWSGNAAIFRENDMMQAIFLNTYKSMKKASDFSLALRCKVWISNFDKSFGTWEIFVWGANYFFFQKHREKENNNFSFCPFLAFLSNCHTLYVTKLFLSGGLRQPVAASQSKNSVSKKFVHSKFNWKSFKIVATSLY